MHYLAIFLCLLLIIISVEARKLTTSNGSVFKLDLIHHDSPNSPYYNSSMTPKERLKRFPLGYISRGHNIHLSSTYYNTSDNNVESSDIIPEPNHGAYLLKLAVGTPKVEFFVSADTGSNLIWVQCLPCESCISELSLPFDPTKSSTFQAIPCNTPACKKPTTIRTGCPSSSTTESSSPCAYETSYGKGSSSGILAMETISLTSSDATSLSLPSTIFGCGMNQTAIEEDGIIGLGMGPSSLISQIGSADINYKFSYCLPPLFSRANGKLALGADVTGSRAVSTPFFISTDSTFYHLTLNGIRVGDYDIQTSGLLSGLDIIIDSGTTYTMIPTSIYYSVKTALESAITLSTTPYPDKNLGLCYNVAGGQVNLPDVVFSFEGADVMLKANNIFREFEDGVSCLAMVASEDQSIFGNIAQINFEVGYDLKANQVSFAPADCANY